MAVAGEAAHALTNPPDDQPVAIVFDFVHPVRTRRRPIRFRRLAGFDEAGGAWQQHGRRIGHFSTIATLNLKLSKHCESLYRGGRSPHWVKVKKRQHPAFGRVTQQFSRGARIIFARAR